MTESHPPNPPGPDEGSGATAEPGSPTSAYGAVHPTGPFSFEPQGYPQSAYSPYDPPPSYSAPHNPSAGYPSSGYGGYGAGDYPAEPATGTPMTQTSEPQHPRGRIRTTLFAAVLAAVVGGGVGAGTVAIADRNDHGTNTGLKITNTTGAPAAVLDGTVSAAAKTIRPSVVTIDVTGSQESGTGSGVIIRDDGHILTNDHVVSAGGSGGKISVTLSDGRTAPGRVIGRDSSDDLAVLKIDGVANLTAATFAKSSSLSVGQTVVAVGAPLGLSDTVTSGIISNLARPVRAGDNDQAVFEAVQTDAAINPGNSGGPLVDLNGSVVGINAAIASDSSGGGLQIPGQPQQQAGSIGIGFAIPSDESSRIASELIATGKATHAVIGVTVSGATTDDSQVGVPLATVTAGGPAAKAGLKTKDVVTRIDTQLVRSADALIAAVRSHAPGDTVSLEYTRDGKTHTVSVTLGSSDS